jgi:putative protease
VADRWPNKSADAGAPPAVELLAPAGDREKLETAIAYGADAVYLSSTQYSLRAQSRNFSPDELADAVCYAHARGVRVYIALNILAHPSDLPGLSAQLRDLRSIRPDGLIISDPGVLSLAREWAPEIALHISTQASVTNARAARFWASQGVRRIILARELTLAEIARIRAEVPTDMELEAFVHGSMCMAYSGRCLLSNFLNSRSANQGECAQPCRFAYEIHESGKPEPALQLEEDSRGAYLLNSRDLCMIEHIPELVAAGISSLKIEGRTKSTFYVATAVKAYREALDRYRADPDHYETDPVWLRDLGKTVHRPFDTGFYFSPPARNAQIFLEDTMIREAAVVGVIRAFLPESHLALIEQRNKLCVGETVEIVQPTGRHLELSVTALLDLERAPIAAAPHPRMYFYLPVPWPVQPGSFLRRLGNKDQPRRQTAPPGS